MANKDDDTWLADYTFGEMTGQGWGFYGQMGNLAYQQKQEGKRQQEERERRYQLENRPKKRIGEERIYSGYKQKPWSSLFAIIGFFIGAGIMYSQPTPSLVVSLLVGLVTGYISGRFYKLILVVGIILLVWWVIAQNP